MNPSTSILLLPFVALTLVAATPTFGQSPTVVGTSAPQITLFERNLFIFTTPQEAIQALYSPNILMRRSGVEWLGRWTYTSYGMSSSQKHFKEFDNETGMVPALTRAVREMPNDNSQQAARLLTLLGPQAKSAIPTVCAALASPSYGDGTPGDGDDSVARADLLSSLIQLCGGSDSLTPALVALMQDRDPETRRAAAAAARFCVDSNNRHFVTLTRNPIPALSLEQDQQRDKRFHQQIFPALTTCVDDPATAVRLDALASLEWLTYNSADAPWQKTLPSLARAVASQDPTIRLAALRVLAYMPCDVSSLASSLRLGLHGVKEEQNYALAAICRSAQNDLPATMNVFLPDLGSSDVLKRQQAASDIQLAAIPLATGDLWPGPYPLEKWDSRLDLISDPPGLTESQREDEAKRRQIAVETDEPILLAALAKSASDSDHAVRASAASSLEQIGNWTNRLLSLGSSMGDRGRKAEPQVEKALAQAALSLQTTEPSLAERLQDLHDKIVRGPSAVF